MSETIDITDQEGNLIIRVIGKKAQNIVIDGAHKI